MLNSVPQEIYDLFGSKRIDKSNEYFTWVHEYFTDESSYKDHKKMLNERKIRLPEAIASYRMINYYEKAGIKMPPREKEAEWRMYSFLDIVWLLVVKQLRDFGLKSKSILTVQNQLIQPYKKSEYGLLEFYTFLVAFNQKPCEILIFPDFTTEIGGFYEITESKEGWNSTSYLTISINEFVQKIVPQNNLKPLYDKAITMDEKEAKVFSLLQSRDYKEMKLFFKNGNVVRVHAKEINKEKTVAEVINKCGWARIEIEKEDGDFVFVERTAKIKL